MAESDSKANRSRADAAPTRRESRVRRTARWLHAGRVVVPDGKGGHCVVEATVELDGVQIQAVVVEDAQTARSRAANHQAALIDHGRDAMLTPAFVDAHVHTPMLYFRGLADAFANRGNVVEDLYYAVESQLQPGDARAFARLGAYELLRAGTATVWEHYYAGHEVAQGLAEAGITAFVAPTLQDVAGPGCAWLEEQWQATFAIAEDTKLRDAGVFAVLGPHASDTVSPALWARIAEAAAANDWPVHCHLAQSVEEWHRADSVHGTTPLGLLQRSGVLDAAPRMLMVHGIFMTQEDLGLLDPSRHTLGFCPFSQLQFSFPADVLRWSRAGASWIVATDCAACNDGLDVQKELRLVAGLRTSWVAQSDEARAFAATGDAATATALDERRKQAFDAAPGWDDPSALLRRVWDVPGALDPRMRTGVLEAGARAHIAVWDATSPAFWPSSAPLRALALGSPSNSLTGLYVSGQAVGGGHGLDTLVQGPEVQEARREADRRLALLLDRLRLANPR